MKVYRYNDNKSCKYTERKWFNTGIGNGRHIEYREQTAYTKLKYIVEIKANK